MGDVRLPSPQPSVGHRIVAGVVPRLRRLQPGVTPDLLRRRVAERQAHETAAGPRPLPTRLVPAFGRRFDVSHDDVDGYRTWTFAPAGRAVARTVLYCHGGGYMSPIDPFHVAWTARLATALGARIVLPDYPIAPTASWRDSRAALVARLAAHSARAEREGEAPLLLAGDSAGGGLALALALAVRDAGGPQPGRLVLHAPWVDLTTSTPETAEAARNDPWLDLEKADVYASWWAGGDDPARWELSPVFGDLTGLPPAMQLYGTRDLLMPGCRLLQRRADEAGWDLSSVEEPGLLHVYGLFPPFVTESRRAFRQVVAFASGDA